MPDIPLTSDGFVDMDSFDGTDPDAFASLDELGGGSDVVPALGDGEWGELLNDVFDGEVDTDLDVDSLVDGADPFDHDEVDADEDPFDLEDLWGGDGGDDGDDLALDDSLDDVDDRTDALGSSDADLEDDLDDDLDLSDSGLDDSLDEGVDDTGSTVGGLVDFDDDGDLGSNVGDLVEFDGDDSVGIDDDLDALENTDFDHS